MGRWVRGAAVAQIGPLAGELPYAAGGAIKRKKKKKEEEREKKKVYTVLTSLPSKVLL